MMYKQQILLFCVNIFGWVCCRDYTFVSVKAGGGYFFVTKSVKCIRTLLLLAND